MLREHAQIKNGEKILDIIASENSHKNYLRYEDRSFDAAIGNQVLQFFPHKIQLLREVIRILKPREGISSKCLQQDRAMPMSSCGFASIN